MDSLIRNRYKRVAIARAKTNTPRFPYPDGAGHPQIKLNEVDGVRVNTDDGWWLLRASNTQNVLVARAEASSEAGLGRLKQLLVEQLNLSAIDVSRDL